MPHIEKRKRKKPYRVHYRAPDGTKRSASFVRRGDADKFAATVETDKIRGAWVDPRRSKLLFEEVAKRYLEEVVHLKPKTRASYESLMRTKLLPAFGAMPLGRIETEDVRRWIAGLKAKGLSASQIRQSYFLLGAILEGAIIDGRIVRNPCTGIKLPKPARKEKQFLTVEQIGALADALGEEYDEAFVYVLAYAGVRWGEAIALRGSRCELLAGRIHIVENLSDVSGTLHLVTPKNSHRRTVKIPPFLRDMLAARLAQLKSLDDLVFTTSSGTPLRYSNFMRRVWKPAAKRAGLPADITPHVLRHTCAALLIGQGAHPKEIQVHLGHSSIAVTMDLYGHLFPDQWDRLTDGLDAAYQVARATRRGDLFPPVESLPTAHRP